MRSAVGSSRNVFVPLMVTGGFLQKIDMIKIMATFALQNWYYVQSDRLGRYGRAEPELSVFKASSEMTVMQAKLMKARRR